MDLEVQKELEEVLEEMKIVLAQFEETHRLIQQQTLPQVQVQEAEHKVETSLEQIQEVYDKKKWCFLL